jgi:hypothetical protein
MVKKDSRQLESSRLNDYVFRTLEQLGLQIQAEGIKLRPIVGRVMYLPNNENKDGFSLAIDITLPERKLEKFTIKDLDFETRLALSFGVVAQRRTELKFGDFVSTPLDFISSAREIWYLRLIRITEGQYNDEVDSWRAYFNPEDCSLKGISSNDPNQKLRALLRSRLNVNEHACLADAIGIVGNFYKGLREIK